MGDVVNLNRFRKTRARAERGKEAEANRILFGRTKAEKLRDSQERERRDRTLDGSRIEEEKKE